MDKKKYALNIKYRMTCAKSDKQNICYERAREDGFYWQEPTQEELSEQFDIIGVIDTDSIDELQQCIEKATLPNGCEAISVELSVYLPGSTGANGIFRRNVRFEYFKDLTKCNHQ